jgi:hypothetical protein
MMECGEFFPAQEVGSTEIFEQKDSRTAKDFWFNALGIAIPLCKQRYSLFGGCARLRRETSGDQNAPIPIVNL